ncbi:MAG: IS3 family transposase [Treponema sp.]|nr:IS3 family transposase [Treponema sp.]
MPEQTLNRWTVSSKKQGEDAFRGSGNLASDKDKEIARLQRELRNANDAISILKKATGITYIWTNEGFMYLSAVIDLFSRKIIAWELSRTMEGELVIKTVNKAKAARKVSKPLIINSDRGSHYKADAYIKATEKMRRSYSKVHYPYGNACIESFHSLIKREWLYSFQIQGYDHCRSLVFEYIETFYNTKRIHSHCGFTSPNEYEAKFQNRKSENETCALPGKWACFFSVRLERL